MTRQHLLVTTVVALVCGGILVLFTDIEQPLLPHPTKASSPPQPLPASR